MTGEMQPQMNADEHRLRANRITETIVGSAFTVSNALGCGFVEKVYENALAIEIRNAGLKVEQQRGVTVRYGGKVVGEFATDLFVEDCVIVELKAVTALDDIHVAQCLNYLKAADLSVGLLLNFGRPRLEVRRVVNRF